VKPWYPLTVFYNGSSAACASEVGPLKRLEHGGRLVFVDCSAPDFDEGVLAGIAIRRADLLARVHARDAHGRWHTGIGALEAAYRAPY
jgi:predicted DCC family thiol-disulfide oxidoreductase YuxK